MGLGNYLELGFLTLLIIRATPRRPFRGSISRVLNPVMPSNCVP